MINVYGARSFCKKKVKTVSPQNFLKNPWTLTPAPRLHWRMLSSLCQGHHLRWCMLFLILKLIEDSLLGLIPQWDVQQDFLLAALVHRSKRHFYWPPEAPIPSGGFWQCIVLDWLHPYHVCCAGKEKHPQFSMFPIWQLTFIRNNSAKGGEGCSGGWRPLAKALACFGRTDQLDWWSLWAGALGLLGQGFFLGSWQLATGITGWGNSLVVLTLSAGSLGTAIVFTFGRLPCYLERFASLRDSE